MTARDEEREQEHRPGAVLYVYTWDLILVILALLVTLAPFAGAVQSSAGVQPLPFYAQVIEAVSSAAFAATLIILAALLTRRHAWVRILQIGTLATHIALAIISEVVLAISGNSAGVRGRRSPCTRGRCSSCGWVAAGSTSSSTPSTTDPDASRPRNPDRGRRDRR
jgi:hypothetical protein